MPDTTLLDIPQEEQDQMLAALRRARYGYLLAFHVLLLCAAGRKPTDIAAFLFCSRSSVYRIVRFYRARKLDFTVDAEGQLMAPVRTTVLDALDAALFRGTPQGSTAGLWLVSDAVELCDAGGPTQDETRRGGVRLDRPTLAP